MEEEEREPSIASSSDLYSESDTPAAAHQDVPTPIKRKAEDLDAGPEKKRKLEHVSSSPSTSYLFPCVGLPPEIWQNVFLFCPPATLGRLLQVNRSFRSYLLDAQSQSVETGRLNVLKSESIWTAARKAHPTRPPKPPEGISEVDLWKLVMGRKCQFCQKAPKSTPGEKAWEKGPGSNGVRIIWPFWARTCGKCLNERCEKDTSLLFSAASALRPALPFAFVASDLNVIAASTLEDPALPPSLQISKVYYKSQIQGMEMELVEARSRGPAAAEEWLKGLESRGRGRMNNSAGWERWELKYQWWLNHQDTRRTPMSISASPSPNYPQTTGSPLRPNSHSMTSNGLPGTSKSPFDSLSNNSNQSPLRLLSPRKPNQIPAASAQALPPRPMALVAQPINAPQHLSQPPLHHPRPERNAHDANEAKAARKADIERRCDALSPPIPANVLRHMESFKAAIQISQPMTTYSWEVLKPRLLAQKAEAERAESEQAARMASLQTKIADRRQQDASLKEFKEVLDREWEDSQKPIRDHLSALADDFIRTKWTGDKSINYDSCPRFAVELLLHVRHEFYSDVSKEDRTANDAQEMDLDQTDRSPRRTLLLENMKWVYDNKIKPLTEQFRKELFLCNGCEGNSRYYGFEGVIQHYGAKHTSAFSVGNIVVSWRETEWPEEPPFHPDPNAARNSGHSVPTSLPAHGHSAYASYYGGYSRGGTTTPQMPLHLSSPSPYIPYGAQFNGPFPPPPPPPNPVHGNNYNYSQGYGQPQPMDSYNGFQPGYLGYSTSPVMNPQIPGGIGPNGLGYHTSPRQMPGTAATVLQEPDKVESEFRTTLFDQQVRSLVEMARDIWTITSGIKDLPNSVRVYALLQSVISKFQLEFHHEPILDHFMDAVSAHSSLRALKSATGLSCKACHGENIGQGPTAHLSRAEDRKTYNVLSLFSHFKSIHLEKFGPRPNFRNGQQLRLLDWKEDMIELPSDRSISGLIHAPGMDDDKLHIIATVFPTLFPTPLPRIGTVDQSGVASASLTGSKNMKEDRETPDTLVEGSGTSPRKSPYRRNHAASLRLEQDEYDPHQPALVGDSRHAAGSSHRRPSHSWSPPPSDRRQMYYTVRSRDTMDAEYSGPPRAYLEVSPNGTRYIRDTGPLYEEVRDRRPVYREREVFPSVPQGAYYTDHPEVEPRALSSYFREAGPMETNTYRGEQQVVRGRARSRSQSPPRAETDAERFLNEFVPPPSLQQKPRKDEGGHQPWPAEGDHDDGSRYSPPPGSGALVQERSNPATSHLRPQPQPHPKGSRYEDARPNGKQIRTPDSGNPPRRSGPHRRRDRQEYIPSRYARYMSAARDDPYAHGHSISRSHSRYERRYERYDEQRRRLDQEGSQPPVGDRDRDISIDRAAYAADENDRDPYYHQLRHSSREHIAVDDHHAPVPSRYAAPPQFIDEFGEPVQYVRVHREAYPTRYDDRERIEYVPVAYDRATLRGEREREYVYYNERPVPRAVEPELERVPFEGEPITAPGEPERRVLGER